MPWYRRLHWQILIGLVSGLVFGLVASANGWTTFTNNWVKPWGTIFINLLKLIAVPLVLASLISGVASLSSLAKLSRIGGKTVAIYLGTTVVAITIGLIVVNILKPGKAVPRELRDELQAQYREKAEKSRETAKKVREAGPLQPLVDVVPENAIASASENKNLLQVVFVALLLGIGLILIDPAKAAPVKAFFDGLTDVVIHVVDLIMYLAPLGVFALIATAITELGGKDPLSLLRALAGYGAAVVLGLVLHVAVVYMVLLRAMTPVGVGQFFRAFRPAQLLAFSTSSSAATLPLSMECVERGLGVSNEITSFTLPLGATVNMDGTALYQAVAAVFIAQVFGMDLTLGQQLTIVLTATLASIGTAAVPSAGIIMLVIILQSVNVPVEGLALILGIDRILDMCRTVVNVTGDAVVTTIVAHTEGKLGAPEAAPPEVIPPDFVEKKDIRPSDLS